MSKQFLGRDYDRDKNQTYRPHDEAMDSSGEEGTVKEEITADILSLLLIHHQQLKQSIYVLKDDSVVGTEKQLHLLQFVDLFMAMSQTEENILYDELRFLHEHEVMTFQAYEMNAVARAIIQELEALEFRLNWSTLVAAKAKVLAEIVEQHLNNEEAYYFSVVREVLPKEELVMLGKEYLRLFEEAKAHEKASLKPSGFWVEN